ncbi:MAG: glycosyltransferase family 4 protein [Gammaproteobacteria bacterium]|nr:MAG: glycosyltransferase family 4 protein [Gammaproteobacteria bacterium]
MKSIIEMASTFPRKKNDTEPKFIYELCKRLTSNFKVIVLAPHSLDAKTEETIDGIVVKRFKYFFSKMQKLAYDGGIANNIKNNRLVALLIPFFLFFNCIALIRILKSEKIDAIHAHWIIPQALVAIIARFICNKNVPILCTSHGGDLYCFDNWLFRKLKIFILKRCEAISVVSSMMKDDIVSWGINANKISVLPMGTDLKNCFYDDKSIQKKDNGILFVGRLVPKKGVNVLIEALKYIPDTITNFRLDIVGDGPERQNLEELTVKLKLNHKVHFLGAKKYDELPAIYRQYPISIVPSITADNGDREGFGLVCVEAIGCGCSVVASNYGAITDIIEDGKTGIIVKQNSPKDLGEAITSLLVNPDLVSNISTNAMKSVAKFDWTCISDKYSTLIEEII